jgi:hypothetical protein
MNRHFPLSADLDGLIEVLNLFRNLEYERHARGRLGQMYYRFVPLVEGNGKISAGIFRDIVGCRTLNSPRSDVS